MKIIKSTGIYGTWDGNSPEQKSFDALNEDFQKMELRLTAIWKPDDDGWEIQFLLEEED